MNSVAALLATFDPDFLLLKPEDKIALTRCTMLYVFRGCKATELTLLMKERMGWTGQQCIDFRGVLRTQGYILFNLKFYIYEFLVCKQKKKPVPKSGLFEIENTSDIRLAASFAKATDKYSVTLRKFCRKWLREGFPPRTLASYRRAMARACIELDIYCRKYAWSSMKFLMSFTSQDDDDLVQDMLDYGVYAIYRAYPQVTNRLHMTNIAKTAIHNRGQNIISKSTTQSRKGLIVTEDATGERVFQSTNLSLTSSIAGAGDRTSFNFDRETQTAALSVCSALHVGLDGHSVEHERPSDVERSRDLKKTVSQLMDKTKGTKLQQFMFLMSGEPDAAFTAFLGEPNEDLFDKNRIEYLNKAREYLVLTKVVAGAFIRHLRTHLADYR